MADKTHHTGSNDGFSLRSPQILTLKDLITIISVAVSLAMAWGVFGTRITVLEREVASIQTTNSKNANEVSDINSQLRRLELRVQDNDHYIDDLYRDAKRPLPRRSDAR